MKHYEQKIIKTMKQVRAFLRAELKDIDTFSLRLNICQGGLTSIDNETTGQRKQFKVKKQ